MGRMLQHRAKDNKWRLWTTISDGWITEWLTENEMKRQIADDYRQDYKIQIIEAYWTFPHGYYDKGLSKMMTNFPAVHEFTQWHLEALESEDYYAKVDEKFNEVIGEDIL